MLYQQKNFMTFWGTIGANGQDGIKQTFLTMNMQKLMLTMNHST